MESILTSTVQTFKPTKEKNIIPLIIEAAVSTTIFLLMAMATIMLLMISTGIWMTVTQMISAGIHMIT